ncbi:MAG: hypothetical protein C0623_13995 [Desulfuromonas sp.]|nr:MAG: hypothetical protein C0623_13995 [Desulfuromonas sp.]
MARIRDVSRQKGFDMQKRKWLLPVLLSFFIAGSVLANTDSALKVEEFIYKGEHGTVTFLHKKHSERNAADCGFCHSALRTFGGTVDQLYGHSICLKCHEERNGPTECGQCHVGIKEDSLNLQSDRDQ